MPPLMGGEATRPPRGQARSYQSGGPAAMARGSGAGGRQRNIDHVAITGPRHPLSMKTGKPETRPSKEIISRSCSPAGRSRRTDIILAARAALSAAAPAGGRLVSQMHDDATGRNRRRLRKAACIETAPRLRWRARFVGILKRRPAPSGRQSRRRGASPAISGPTPGSCSERR